MMEWQELPNPSGQFHSSEVAGPMDTALPIALEGILAKLGHYNAQAATHDVYVMLEANVDTGRIIAAVTSSEDSARRDGCAVRLQSLQDLWYDLDDSLADEVAFTSAIQRIREEIGAEFVALLRRDGRRAFPGAHRLRLTVAGGEPGEVLCEIQVF